MNGAAQWQSHAPFQQPRATGPAPQRTGLGAAHGLPRQPAPQGMGSFVPAATSASFMGEKYSLFVGGIAGIEDGWLERILGTAGTVLSLRRPSPAFAFVEYGDPESVLRCLEVVNGTKIVVRDGAEKVITVKADAKTTDQLKSYESTRVKQEHTGEITAQAKDDLDAIVRLIATGSAPTTAGILADQRAPMTNLERANLHLQDLAAEDLPEENRGVITGEIALFRERSARREAEKRAAESRRLSGANQYRPQQQQQQFQRPPQGSSQRNEAFGPASVDPQSYNKPIGFLAAGTKPEPSLAGRIAPQEDVKPVFVDHEKIERERLDRVVRDAEQQFQDRERRFEQREKQRIAGVERERARERAIAEAEDRDRVATRERLALWDDEVVAREGKELFYSDRHRWRAQRSTLRKREEEADARDARIEAQQLAAVSKASEDFLNQQADMMAKMSEEKRLHSLPTPSTSANPDEPVVKLSFGSTLPKPVPKVLPAVKSSAFLGAGEEEEEGKKKRALIPLDYSDEEDDGSGRKQQRKREKKQKEILDKIPESQSALWEFAVEWTALTEAIITNKLGPFANSCIIESLGASEAEILDVIIEHLRAHKSAADLVAELEPVLDEEAAELVTKLWRVLIHETLLAQAGL